MATSDEELKCIGDSNRRASGSDVSGDSLESLSEALVDSTQAVRGAVATGDLAQIEAAMEQQRVDFQKFKRFLETK